MSELTIMDGFCGAGGSSLGCEYAGVQVKLALNHNDKSLATHTHNFPRAEHAKVDISQENPKKYPHTDFAWFSPECTRHSTSSGTPLLNQNQPVLPGMEWTDRDDDPFTERSRATMWDVCRWTSAKIDQGHPFQLVFVENVPKVTLWGGYQQWLKEMQHLGYCYRTAYINSMFAPPFPEPIPQSRDRWYTVFYRKGNKAPDLDFHPAAYCCHCQKQIAAIQSWKNPRKKRGDYKRQYVYRCPRCAREVVPPYHPAFSVIDWSLATPLIGERKAHKRRPLKPKTIERIEVGLERFERGMPFLVETTRTHAGNRRSHPVTCALPTMCTTQDKALIVPPDATPFLMSYYGKAVYRSIRDALGTCTSRDRHALIMRPDTGSPRVEDCGFRMLTMPEIKKAMGFPDSYTIVCSSQKEGVRQCGLAVTPAVAALLVARGLESMGYEIPQGLKKEV